VGADVKPNERFDAVIAGAGPAGLTAALRLVGGGARVLVADARATIGAPLRCGEATFEDLFEIVGVEPRDGWIRRRGLRQRFVERSMFVIDRSVVERELADITARRGAEVLAGTSVTAVSGFDGGGREVTLRSRRGERRVHARCVIAADGVSSSVARQAGVDTYLHPDAVCSGLAYIVTGARLMYPYQGYIERLPAPFPAIPYYFWVIPHADDTANVGLYLPGRDGARARSLLERMIAGTDAIAGGTIVQTVVGIVPDTPPIERPYADGLMICGGAARMILPLSAGGIAPAAISGKHAAKTLLDLDGAPATADRLTGYRTALEPLYSLIGNKWKLRRELERRGRGEARG